MVKEVIKTGQLKEAWKAGRVEKYMVDLGWTDDFRIYVVYGRPGGAREVFAMNETIIEAIEEEMSKDPRMPTMILRDFTATPCDLSVWES